MQYQRKLVPQAMASVAAGSKQAAAGSPRKGQDATTREPHAPAHGPPQLLQPAPELAGQRYSLAALELEAAWPSLERAGLVALTQHPAAALQGPAAPVDDGTADIDNWRWVRLDLERSLPPCPPASPTGCMRESCFCTSHTLVSAGIMPAYPLGTCRGLAAPREPRGGEGGHATPQRTPRLCRGLSSFRAARMARQDIVLVASLVDKLPNLAGLARTAEVSAHVYPPGINSHCFSR